MHNRIASDCGGQEAAGAPSHVTDLLSLFPRTVLGIAGSLLLGACAAQNLPGSRTTQLSFDQAAVFGTLVDEFLLPDGSEASIRRMNNQYSVKLQRQFRVIEIGYANNVRFRSAQMVDGYALIVLEKAERNCPVKNQLLAIRGSEVRSWEIGNCRNWPEVTIYSNAATFDVEEGRSITRYQFTGGRLLYGEPPAPPAAPQVASAPEPSAANPGSPPKKAVTTASSARPAAGATPYVPTAAPIFKPREQAPRTIYLDK